MTEPRAEHIIPEGESTHSQSEEDRPLAIGLEMPEGQWVLEHDGTLHFSRGSHLVGGAFDTNRSKVRRIVIDDFTFIGSELFQRYNACEELVVTAPKGTICSRAFSHCHNLARVCVPEGWDVDPSAFEDTPWQTALDDAQCASQTDMRQPIADDPHGKAFLEAFQQELELMHTQKDGERLLTNTHWKRDANIWFCSCLKVLAKGWLSQEPTLTYLAAECVQFAPWNEGDILIGEMGELLGLVADPDDDAFSAERLYVQAAEWGSPHAQLWCAYCYDQGKGGMDKDPTRAQHFLSLYRAQGEPLATLELDELDFAYDELLMLAEEAHDADIQEDLVGYETNYDWNADYPNPSWRTLHLRSIDLACFLIGMGRTYQTGEIGYYYEWPRDFNARGARLAELKEDWLDWCEERELVG